MNMTGNRTLDYALRTLQLLFAIIIMGTDGYAIFSFHGHTEYVESPFGNFYAHIGVPNAWGFLLFCAGWTVLVVIFHLVAGVCFAYRASVGYICAAGEAVAVLSWFAGFMAVAIEIAGDVCPQGKSSCGPLVASVVFGAFESLLFMVTAAQTVMPVYNTYRKGSTSTTKRDVLV